MKTTRYIYWRSGDFWIGHLEEFPDYHTQGESLEDLEDHLRDLHKELNSGVIPGVKRMGELEIA